MRVSFLHSLPVRLAGLILLLSGIMLLILTEINRRAVERILLDQSEVQAMLSTVAVVDGLDAVIGTAEEQTRFVARDLAGRTPTAKEIERVARNVMLDQKNIFGFSIAFEPQALAGASGHCGIYVHRSKAARRHVALDLTTPDQAYWNQDWYRQVIDRAHPIWSEPFYDRATDRNMVRISVPIFRDASDKRDPIGVAAAVIDLGWLRRLTNLNEFSDTSYTIIFSRTGRIIIHPRPNYAIAETIESLAQKENAPQLVSIQQSVRARRQGALTYRDTVLNHQVHVNYKPTKVAGWGVIVGYQEQEFLKTQRTFRWISAAFLASTLLILAGIVIGVTRYALRPLRPLAAAAGEIAQRNLNCEIPEPVRDDEVGYLTRSFQSMRDALKKQHMERRWASQSLEHQLKYNNLIIDSIGELVFVLTKVLSISRINPAVTQVAGYKLTDVLRAPLGKIVQLGSPETGADGVPTDTLLEAVKTGRTLHDLPAKLATKNGDLVACRLTLVPLQDSNKIVGAVATLLVETSASKDPA